MSDQSYIPTICPYCGVGCGFYLVVQGGQAVGIEYFKDHPVCGGRLCAKGNAALEVLVHPDRLSRPLKKENGSFLPVDWDEALDLAAEKLKGVAGSSNADRLGFLASAKCTNEENYLFQKLARKLGTNNVDHCARLCHAPTVTSLARAFGGGAMTNPLSDLALADCLFVIGSNPAENHTPALSWMWRAKDGGANIIVADPRRTPTSWLADEYLPLRPGSDAALLGGMMRVILKEGLHDRDFISKRTEGFEAAAEAIEKFTLEKSAHMTGLAEARIVRAARNFARAKAGAVVYCMGVAQHTSGVNNVAACANLALLTGNLGRPGTGVYPLRGQNNVQGACDMGALPQVYPGYLKAADPEARSRMAKEWNAGELPGAPGLTVVEMIKAAEAGEIKAMWIMGENPVVSDPNTSRVREALSSLDFLIVQDLFLTETAELADLVLPAAAWAEKAGTFTNTERRVQWFDRAVKPPGEARSDLWIISEIGRRLGIALGGDDPEAVLAEINRVVESYAGIVKSRAVEPGGVHWPCPHQDHPGTPILHEGIFATSSGKARFAPTEFGSPAEEADDDFPLLLTTGRLAIHYNSGSMTRRTEVFDQQASGPEAWLHPGDASRWGISSGDPVKVATRRGEAVARAKVTSAIEAGVVFLPFHFPGINDLTNDALAPEALIPEYKVAACRVEKGGVS